MRITTLFTTDDSLQEDRYQTMATKPEIRSCELFV